MAFNAGELKALKCRIREVGTDRFVENPVRDVTFWDGIWIITWLGNLGFELADREDVYNKGMEEGQASEWEERPNSAHSVGFERGRKEAKCSCDQHREDWIEFGRKEGRKEVHDHAKEQMKGLFSDLNSECPDGLGCTRTEGEKCICWYSGGKEASDHWHTKYPNFLCGNCAEKGKKIMLEKCDMIMICAKESVDSWQEGWAYMEEYFNKLKEELK